MLGQADSGIALELFHTKAVIFLHVRNSLFLYLIKTSVQYQDKKPHSEPAQD